MGFRKKRSVPQGEGESGGQYHRVRVRVEVSTTG